MMPSRKRRLAEILRSGAPQAARRAAGKGALWAMHPTRRYAELVQRVSHVMRVTMLGAGWLAFLFIGGQFVADTREHWEGEPRAGDLVIVMEDLGPEGLIDRIEVVGPDGQRPDCEFLDLSEARVNQAGFARVLIRGLRGSATVFVVRPLLTERTDAIVRCLGLADREIGDFDERPNSLPACLHELRHAPGVVLQAVTARAIRVIEGERDWSTDSLRALDLALEDLCGVLSMLVEDEEFFRGDSPPRDDSRSRALADQVSRHRRTLSNWIETRSPARFELEVRKGADPFGSSSPGYTPFFLPRAVPCLELHEGERGEIALTWIP